MTAAVAVAVQYACVARITYVSAFVCMCGWAAHSTYAYMYARR